MSDAGAKPPVHRGGEGGAPSSRRPGYRTMPHDLRPFRRGGAREAGEVEQVETAAEGLRALGRGSDVLFDDVREHGPREAPADENRSEHAVVQVPAGRGAADAKAKRKDAEAQDAPSSGSAASVADRAVGSDKRGGKRSGVPVPLAVGVIAASVAAMVLVLAFGRKGGGPDGAGGASSASGSARSSASAPATAGTESAPGAVAPAAASTTAAAPVETASGSAPAPSETSAPSAAVPSAAPSVPASSPSAASVKPAPKGTEDPYGDAGSPSAQPAASAAAPIAPTAAAASATAPASTSSSKPAASAASTPTPNDATFIIKPKGTGP